MELNENHSIKIVKTVKPEEKIDIITKIRSWKRNVQNEKYAQKEYSKSALQSIFCK